MAVNKVVYSGKTLIDLSNDTVTSEKLLTGETAHAANGEIIVGSMKSSKEFIPLKVSFGSNTVTETNGNDSVVITRKSDGSVEIVQTLDGIKKVITTKFNSDGSITTTETSNGETRSVTTSLSGSNIINTIN
jgi:hypothetical protein